MALAVAEAQRVLRPGGHLLDIHPAAEPMRLEAWLAWPGATSAALSEDSDAHDRVLLGRLAPEEYVGDFEAASAALAAAAEGFRQRQAVLFDYRYFFDSLDEFTDYLEDNDELDLASDELLEQALHTLERAATPARLVLVQPVVVTLLEKRPDR